MLELVMTGARLPLVDLFVRGMDSKERNGAYEDPKEPWLLFNVIMLAIRTSFMGRWMISWQEVYR